MKFKSIDHYISTFSVSVQKALKEIRATIKATVPEAEEAISYNMPAFRVNGDYFVHFAAAKAHIGMYPIPEGNETFQKEVLKYKSAKSSMHFSLDKPMPVKFISKVVKFRVAENRKRAKAKSNKKK